MKRLSQDQIEKVHYWDFRAGRPLEAFEIKKNLGIQTEIEKSEADYWQEVARRIFPEELKWSLAENDYIRRPEIKAEVEALAEKHSWMKREPWNADVLLCWHEFDWEVKRAVPEYSRPRPQAQETERMRNYQAD